MRTYLSGVIKGMKRVDTETMTYPGCKERVEPLNGLIVVDDSIHSINVQHHLAEG